MRRFNKILIANRGEIAVRIIKSAKKNGYKTVAIFSELDSNAIHVRLADESVCIGPALAQESYLNMETIISAAKRTSAQAIHPGYGFLSENSNFAKLCISQGIVFIGPPIEAIEIMGNKAASKRLMIKSNIPCIPGYEGENQSNNTLLKASKNIGFPIMVKSAAGGGGKGMRFVEEETFLLSSVESAQQESLSSFGSDELILEKYLVDPRHIEIQIFGDEHGHYIHLGERECSIQRRHQKVIEESPSVFINDKLRNLMAITAINVAKSVNYIGAGTVEFLVDKNKDFYFLEMNTRLQVEHPVTEMVTGIDLVDLQLKVAQGEKINLTQNDIQFNGHAIQARLYAEDPSNDFLPQIGKIDLWKPLAGNGIRIDSGIESNNEISRFYDPMLAKIISWADNRDDAIQKLKNALEKSVLFGIKTNKSFLFDILSIPNFTKGNINTSFIKNEFNQKYFTDNYWENINCSIAAVLQFIKEREVANSNAISNSDILFNWSNSGFIRYIVRYIDKSNDLSLVVSPLSRNSYQVDFDVESMIIDVDFIDDNKVVINSNNIRYIVYFFYHDTYKISLSVNGRVNKYKNQFSSVNLIDNKKHDGRVISPMHGQLLKVLVKKGDHVQKGDSLAVIEAMKMQHNIESEVNGVINRVHMDDNTQISSDDLIIEIDIKNNKTFKEKGKK